MRENTYHLLRILFIFIYSAIAICILYILDLSGYVMSDLLGVVVGVLLGVVCIILTVITVELIS